MKTKPHRGRGNKNAAKPAEARVSEARIAVSVGTMLDRIDAAAAAAGLSRAAWCRQALERQLAAENDRYS